MKELEKTLPGSTRIHHASSLFSEQKSWQYEAIIAQSRPLIFSKLPEIARIFKFIKNILLQSNTMPIILSPFAFEEATLKKNRVKIFCLELMPYLCV